MSVLDRLTALVSPAAALRLAGVLAAEGKPPRRTFPLYARAARAKLPEAEYRVGRCYLEGAGVPLSRQEGVRWLERAAGQGYLEAQALLAALYIHGLGSRPGADVPPGARPASRLFASNATNDPDFVPASRWARMAAEGGSADGQAVLAYILTSGPEAMRDLDQAHRWYERSADGGCPQGMLGYALSLARDAKDDAAHRKVADYMSRAAEAEMPTALYLMGILYDRGVGMARDVATAAQLYRRAAEKGNRSDQARWGLMLMEGRGGDANPDAGESWLRRAALGGDPEAAALVGDLYAKGGKLPPNYAEAALWFRRAAD